MNSPFTFNDSFDWVKQLWGGFSGSATLPAMATPTLDVKEIEQRIADLKTVEHWLNVNLSLLRTTIQGMEVQRGTLAALQTFGANFAAMPDAANTVTPATKAGATAATANAAATPPASAPLHAASDLSNNLSQAWWDLLQQQFQQIAQPIFQETMQVKTNTEKSAKSMQQPPVKLRKQRRATSPKAAQTVATAAATTTTIATARRRKAGSGKVR